MGDSVCVGWVFLLPFHEIIPALGVLLVSRKNDAAFEGLLNRQMEDYDREVTLLAQVDNLLVAFASVEEPIGSKGYETGVVGFSFVTRLWC